MLNKTNIHNNTTLVGCADSGCTSHFICEDTPCTNKKLTQNSIIVSTPNGSTMTASHSADINLNHLISDLPPQATKATILPSLKQPLLSLGQFCDAGSNVLLTKQHVYLQPQDIPLPRQATSIGTRNPVNGLWDIPLSNKTIQTNSPTHTANSASSAYNYDTKADLISFLHAAAFSPTVATWCAAIDAGFFLSWPGLTSAAVRKHLPKSLSTYKGHQKEIKQGLRSTKSTKACLVGLHIQW